MADPELQRLSAQIVSAFVRHNTVPLADVSRAIVETYDCLTNLGSQGAPDLHIQRPAVPVKKSVSPDAVICLECGAKFHMLKRHLRTAHDLTVEAYLTKWSLPSDHPIVAPNYTARRSEAAKALGLGRKKAVEIDAPKEPKPHQYPASRWSKPVE